MPVSRRRRSGSDAGSWILDNPLFQRDKLTWHGLCRDPIRDRDNQKGERMNKLTATAIVLLTSLGLGACSSNPSNAQIGAATGAVIGGVVGSAVTGGSTAGTVAGAGAGAAAGYEIGRRIK
jgi:osmotically inducible lipoprotein OsmB